MNCPHCKRPKAQCDADACVERIDEAGACLARSVGLLAACRHEKINEQYELAWCESCGAIRYPMASGWTLPARLAAVKVYVERYDALMMRAAPS